MPAQRDIQYDTARLDEQYPMIRESRDKAVVRIYKDAYKRVLGIKPGDPGELWKYALRKLGSSSIPAAGRSIVLKCWRESQGAPSFGASLDVLLRRFAGRESKLIAATRKLLDLAERPPVSDADLEAAIDPTDRYLVQHWIAERHDPLLLYRSLCFFSNEAMAKAMHYFRMAQVLKLERWGPERERVTKRYERLNLTPAKPRIIRDFKVQAGQPLFLPFAKRTAR
ncbi:MAG: hypothetical protein AB9869_27285 [Verrucomicrobiia bacterium]